MFLQQVSLATVTLDQAIALAASLAAALSAVATLLTVRQMTKQRQASYRPELMFTSKLVSADRGESTLGPPTYWQDAAATTSPDSVVPQKAESSIAINLINVGLGAAKYVNIRWDFPVAKMVANINHLAQKALVGSYLEYENGILSIKTSENRNRWVHMWVNQRNMALDYVLPASSSTMPTEISLPPAYLQLISELVHFAGISSELGSAFDSVPSLTAELTYHDIGGRGMKTCVEIAFEFSVVHGQGEQFKGRFVPRLQQKESAFGRIGIELARQVPSILLPFAGTVGFRTTSK